MLLADLALRAGDFRAHYTDFGIAPRAELAGYGWRSVWNLHALASPSPLAVGVLFAVAACAAAALALGWRTRAATFVSWLLVSSIQYRQPALAFGADVMLRMLLFWGLFLPLGARWSLDARRAGARPEAEAHLSLASAALILQLALVYVFTVLNRTGPTWWDGRALHDALHFDQFASRGGIWLREHGEAWLAPLTHVAIWFEALAPLLLLCPVANGPVRTLAVALFLGFHAALGLLFDIGLFPAVFGVAWLGMLPTWFWRRFPAARAAELAPLRWQPRFARDGLAAVALFWVLATNAASLRDGQLAARLPKHWDLPAQLLNLDQLWGLFSPDPPVYDGWYAFKGIRRDGAEADPFAPEQPFGFGKPAVVTESMNIRWREFFFRLQRDAQDPRWRPFGAWLCRAWNERHTGDQRLERVYVYYVEETTRVIQPQGDRTLTLLAHGCEAPAP